MTTSKGSTGTLSVKELISSDRVLRPEPGW